MTNPAPVSGPRTPSPGNSFASWPDITTTRPARPLSCGRPAGCAGRRADVVEQRRSGRNDAADLLGQGQRRVLVGEQPGRLGPHRGRRVGHAYRANPHPHGRVFIDGPGTSSAPAPASSGPNRTVPEHHVVPAGQQRPAPRAHTRWNTWPGRHPPLGRLPQSAAIPPSGGALACLRRGTVAVHVGQAEHRGRLGHIGRAGKVLLVLRPRLPSRAWATKSRNGSGSGSGSPSPGQQHGDLAQDHLQRRVVYHQVMHPHQRQPPAGAWPGYPPPRAPRAAGPGQVHPRAGRRPQPGATSRPPSPGSPR